MTADAWRLDGRVIMVSGAAGGIGTSVAEVLGAAGATLSLCDLRNLDAAAGTVWTVGDLAEDGVAARWAEQTLERFGRIDGLINVAGVWQSSPFVDIDAVSLQRIWNANFLTAWNACHAVAPYLLERGAGAIVNFASTAGQYGSVRPGAHYAAAKGAVIALTKTLARELSPLGVRVNAISPGPVDTDALGSGVALDDDEVKGRTLLRRAGRPVEVAHGVLYLVSDASAFATGSVLNVNGGSLL